MKIDWRREQNQRLVSLAISYYSNCFCELGLIGFFHLQNLFTRLQMMKILIYRPRMNQWVPPHPKLVYYLSKFLCFHVCFIKELRKSCCSWLWNLVDIRVLCLIFLMSFSYYVISMFAILLLDQLWQPLGDSSVWKAGFLTVWKNLEYFSLSFFRPFILAPLFKERNRAFLPDKLGFFFLRTSFADGEVELWWLDVKKSGGAYPSI